LADTKISALTAIDAVAGGDKVAVADASDLTASKSATADQLKTYIAPAAATQAEQESASNLTVFVSPGRQHFHPSAAKFWVRWTGNSTTILASYNMTSIADTGVGDADGTIATDFSNANWAGFVSTEDTTVAWDAANVQGSGFNAKAAGTFGVLCSTITDGGTAVASLTDPDQWNVVGFGDQA
jgi:hypothetical protein